MDVKGINWVGHMYQKYESMLLEVEEDIYQDVVNYVENQVQTVGDSVKKFYSDVIQDLLPPPSADPFKSGDSDLSIEKYADVCAYKKTKGGTKEEPGNVKAERVMDIPEVIDMEVENRASSFQGLSNVNSSSADSLNGLCSELYSTAYEDASMHDYSSYDTKIDTGRKNMSTFMMAGAVTKGGSGSGCFEYLHENHEASSDEIAGSISGRDEIEYQSNVNSYVPVDDQSKSMSSSHNWVSIVRSAPNGDEQCIDADISGKKVDKVIASNSGDDSDEREIGDNKNIIDQDSRTIQQGDHLKLKETCILVNGDEVHFAPQRKGKCRPSKKKTRDALSLRKNSVRTQEYEQLAVWYGSESLKPVPSMEEKRSLATSHICESEWELL